MYKYKSNISKTHFYILLTQIALLTAALFVWLLIPFGLGINTSNYQKITKDLTNEQISELGQQIAMRTLISYLANTFIILFFLVYLVLLRHKHKHGYIFIYSWVVVFITLAASPFFNGTELLSTLQLVFGSLITIINISIIITLIYLLFQYHIKRKFHYYEWFKIHKGGSK